jgi:hypothetical protein
MWLSAGAAAVSVGRKTVGEGKADTCEGSRVTSGSGVMGGAPTERVHARDDQDCSKRQDEQDLHDFCY